MINHWVFFKSESSSLKFGDWVGGSEFAVDYEESFQNEDGEFVMCLFHRGKTDIKSITNTTLALRRKAAEYGGEYDGWETSVQK